MIQPSEVAESVGWANANLSNYREFLPTHQIYVIRNPKLLAVLLIV